MIDGKIVNVTIKAHENGYTVAVEYLPVDETYAKGTLITDAANIKQALAIVQRFIIHTK